MFQWVKNLFKRNKANLDLEELVDIEDILEERYKIVEKNIGMIIFYFNLSNSDCAALEAMLRMTADGLVSGIYENEAIIKNNLVLRCIYCIQPSFKLAEDLCNYEMSFEEFAKRIFNGFVEFKKVEDETNRYKELNSKNMIKKIDKSSSLMVKNIKNNKPFSIYVRANLETDVTEWGPLYFDDSVRNISLDIIDNVSRELNNSLIPLIIKIDDSDIDLTDLAKLLNNDVIIPILEMTNSTILVNELSKTLNYYIIMNKYKNKRYINLDFDYSVVTENEDIQVILERRLKQFTGYKYIKELFSNSIYPNDYFKKNVNYACIEYMRHLFMNKMIKTKDEIVTAFVDFISTQYTNCINRDKLNNKVKKAKKENNDVKNNINKPNPEKDFYKFEYSNTDLNLTELANSLSKNKDARILFHGISGTGKSLFAKKLAEKLNMSIKIVKCSDILKPFVGESEQSIARVFEEVDPDNTILVFDEIDSFISERKTSINRWEISQANEMLVQLENFKGIFIGTTNLMDNLDSAFYRRFDIKVKFDFMKKEDSISLFKDYMKDMNLKVKDSDISKLKSMNVTPAMFSVVKRRSKYETIKNANDYLNKLEKECKYVDKNSNNKIGFFN